MLQGEGDSTTSVSLTITGTSEATNLELSNLVGLDSALVEVVNLTHYESSPAFSEITVYQSYKNHAELVEIDGWSLQETPA